MSRRREAQDLERVLALSLQEQGEAPTSDLPPSTKTPDQSTRRGASRTTTQSSSSVAPSSSTTQPTKPIPAARPALSAKEARKKLFGKPISSLLHTSSPKDKGHLAHTSRYPGLHKSVKLPTLHTNRRSPPPKRLKLPTKEKKPVRELGSDEELESEPEPEPEPEIDYENEGFL